MITNKRIINKIEAALDEIRPYLKTDGGDISLVEITVPSMISSKPSISLSNINSESFFVLIVWVDMNY